MLNSGLLLNGQGINPEAPPTDLWRWGEVIPPFYRIYGHKEITMYTDINFKTKKELKEAVAAGKQVTVYLPGGMFESKRDGNITIEGPHYPKPHSWYASATIKDGIIVAGTVK